MDEAMNSAEEMTEQETSDFEEAFSEDAGEEATEEATEEKNGEEETPEEEENAGDQKEEQKIIVNGKEYTQEEIAQKLAEPPQRYGVLERLADEAGMSVDEYLANVEEQYEKSQMDERAKERAAQLIEQGMEENLANHLAQVEVENANFKAKAERAAKQAQEMGQKQNESRAQAEQRMQAEIAEFDRLYPGVKEFPPEVLEEIKQTGHSPVVAYQNYLLKKQESELMALKQAKKNKETTPGPAKGTSKGQPDPFLSTFMKEY